MRLRLRTKLTLVMTALVLAMVAVVSAVFVARLATQVVRAANDRARFVAQEAFLQARHALAQAASQGLRPATNNPDDTREYVRRALEDDPGLSALLDAAVGYSPSIDEVTIADSDGVALLSSDPSIQGRYVPRRLSLAALLQGRFLEQMAVLYGPPRLYEVDLPFTKSGKPFGDVRVGLSSALLRNELTPSLHKAGEMVLVALLVSTALAAFVSRATLAPLTAISKQLDRISAGQFDPPAPPAKGLVGRGDELGQVSQKITRVGQQLRGVHEIFSSLRENLDQVMGGLEDGLILFTRDSRAVMVSPAAEKFLGASASEFLGRCAEEIFPPESALRQALRLDGQQFETVAAAEAQIETPQGSKRVSVSVQPIEEGGTRMGALVTLRDLDSLESIHTQLQVSERLAAMGRVTAGVAHEVKNPLNSMRLWLENLRESLSHEQVDARQAVHVLDKEIDRLDTVVKRFLDFTRPVEVHLEETQLTELLEDVLRVAGPQLQRAHVQVAQLLPADVPRVYVDRALLKQAVLNLVLNAAQAMENGGQLRLMLSRRGDMAEIAVGDTGCGIAPENRQKIFQLFFTTRPGGSGIGLASAFRIVQLHNGSIDFSSEPGRGTTFRIELPLAS